MTDPLKDILTDVAEKRIDADEGVRRVERLIRALEEAKRTEPVPVPYRVPYEPWWKPYNPCDPWPWITWQDRLPLPSTSGGGWQFGV